MEKHRKRVSEWPLDDQPKHKLAKHGPGSLTEAELLSLLISPNGQYNSVEIAHEVVREEPLAYVAERSPGELAFLYPNHLTKTAAIKLAAVFELTNRIAGQRGFTNRRLKITEPEVILHRFDSQIGYLDHEVFMILMLNSANYLIKYETISKGILNSSLVHPREVFGTAILNKSASIILMHNHPSGEPYPSQEDKDVTKRLVEVGKTMDIPVLDHIIISRGKYFSFEEAGLIYR